MLLHSATLPLPKPPQSGADLPQIIACCPGILLLLGLWTPVAGTLVATAEIWAIVAGTTEPRLSAILATLGASLAMIGPGAWSVDARLFGRKRIDTREE
jgi:putative oxidoreductase